MVWFVDWFPTEFEEGSTSTFRVTGVSQLQQLEERLKALAEHLGVEFKHEPSKVVVKKKK